MKVDLQEVEKLLAEAKGGLKAAQKALASIQPVIDKLDDVMPDVGPGQYLHMVRVAVDLFENAIGKQDAKSAVG